MEASSDASILEKGGCATAMTSAPPGQSRGQLRSDGKLDLSVSVAIVQSACSSSTHVCFFGTTFT